jgi:hypothetical protein
MAKKIIKKSGTKKRPAAKIKKSKSVAKTAPKTAQAKKIVSRATASNSQKKKTLLPELFKKKKLKQTEAYASPAKANTVLPKAPPFTHFC